jgi:hypothetical protein
MQVNREYESLFKHDERKSFASVPIFRIRQLLMLQTRLHFSVAFSMHSPYNSH